MWNFRISLFRLHFPCLFLSSISNYCSPFQNINRWWLTFTWIPSKSPLVSFSLTLHQYRSFNIYFAEGSLFCFSQWKIRLLGEEKCFQEINKQINHLNIKSRTPNIFPYYYNKLLGFKASGWKFSPPHNIELSHSRSWTWNCVCL